MKTEENIKTVFCLRVCAFVRSIDSCLCDSYNTIQSKAINFYVYDIGRQTQTHAEIFK